MYTKRGKLFFYCLFPLLKQKVRSFFIKHYQYKLRLSEYLPLYNWWFVGVVVSNVLVSIGTILFLVTSYIVRKPFH